jgi:hypothetical protein
MCGSVNVAETWGDATAGARQGTEPKQRADICVLPGTVAHGNVLPYRVVDRSR